MRIFLIAALLINCFSLLSMDGSCNSMIIRDALVNHIGHKALCALNLVDTTFNKKIKDGVEQRVHYLKKYAVIKNGLIDDKQVMWHKNGSAYMWADVEDHQCLHLNFVYLGNCSKIINRFGKWQEDKFFVIEGSRPFINNQGNVSFYAVKKGGYWPNSFLISVFEYSLTAIGQEKYSCVIDSQGEFRNHQLARMCGGLAIFLRYPVLLRAILNSTQVRQDEKVKRYNIDGVIIPDNYGEFKDHEAFEDEGVFSYDDFSLFDRQIIDTIYQEQQCKKVQLTSY